VRGSWIASAAVLPAVALSPSALAAPRQSGTIAFTTTAPGAPTGIDTALDFTNPDQPDQKAPSLRSFSITFPAGTVIDTAVQDQCHATDAELYLEGAAACPSSSRVGGGTLVSDTGSTDPSVPRYVTNVVTQFNAQDDLRGVADSQSSPSFRTITHSRLSGTTYNTIVPPFPTFSASDPFTGFKSWRLHDDPFVKAGRASFSTPPRCPSTRYWTVTASFAYWDGVTQALASRSPCTRRSTGA